MLKLGLRKIPKKTTTATYRKTTTKTNGESGASGTVQSDDTKKTICHSSTMKKSGSISVKPGKSTKMRSKTHSETTNSTNSSTDSTNDTNSTNDTESSNNAERTKSTDSAGSTNSSDSTKQ